MYVLKNASSLMLRCSANARVSAGLRYTLVLPLQHSPQLVHAKESPLSIHGEGAEEEEERSSWLDRALLRAPISIPCSYDTDYGLRATNTGACTALLYYFSPIMHQLGKNAHWSYLKFVTNECPEI